MLSPSHGFRIEISAPGHRRSSVKSFVSSPRFRCSRVPIVTMITSALVVALALMPAAAQGLQLEREAVVRGEWWRLLTAHFVHFGPQNLGMNLLAFAALAAWCERLGRLRLVCTILISSLATSVSVFCLQPDWEIYRGLSGVDSALFGVLFFTMAREARGWMRALVAAPAVVFLGKVLFEFFSGRALFVDAAAESFQPVPLAHLCGVLVGTAVHLYGCVRPTRGLRCDPPTC